MLMSGKKGIIMGLANNMSIAYGIAKAVVENGGEIIITYQGEALLKRVTPIAQELGCKMIIECDVSKEESIKEMADKVEKEYGKIDFLVHSIGFSDKNELRGRYADTTRANFLNTMDISCFSFTSVLKNVDKILNDGSTAITLTYYGAEKYMPHYNVMGVAKAALEASLRYLAVDFGVRNIRVNGISAGPIKTLAASGIGDFKKIFKWNEENTPLHRNTTIEEVGGNAVYLLSNLSSGVTGEVIHVDSGYHVMGMKMVDGESD
jgi:enoyl-[acyl-carrier protein] reductase I